MNEQVTYTIVVPVYNGSASLSELCLRIVNVMQPFPFELLFVNDASTDNSWDRIIQLKEQYPNIVRAISLERNYGQHAALLCAFGFCRGSFIITIDDDLQYDPEDIMKLIDKQKETDAEIIYGLVDQKQHSVMRNIATSYVSWTSRLDRKNGKGTSFRLMSKRVTDLIAANHKYNFVFIDEVLQWYTSSVSHVEVQHHPRVNGRSGYSWGKLLKFYLNILTNYSALPLRLMIYAGSVFSLVFFFMGLIFMLRKVLYNVPIGYTSIIVTILFSASIIMFCLGVIGLYLFKIYAAQHNKPLFTIKKII